MLNQPEIIMMGLLAVLRKLGFVHCRKNAKEEIEVKLDRSTCNERQELLVEGKQTIRLPANKK